MGVNGLALNIESSCPSMGRPDGLIRAHPKTKKRDHKIPGPDKHKQKKSGRGRSSPVCWIQKDGVTNGLGNKHSSGDSVY